MVDMSLLKETIADRGITITALAKKTGISRDTIYNKLRGKKGEFTASQIVAFTDALYLTNEERDKIFLS